MEHRWGERVPLDLPAQLLLPDGSHAQGRVRNASISGALIETPVKLGPLATVTIALTGGTPAWPRTIELPACVARIARDCVAVEWRDIGIPTMITLLQEVGGHATRRARNVYLPTDAAAISPIA
jgi:hypothetical protein